MKRLCVFCGSSSGIRPAHTEAAAELGRQIVARGLGLVYGAGHIGLMGVLADAALAAGGEVIGCIPRSLVERELAHQRLTELHVVQTMHQRKALMERLSDGFVALPGGYGTLDELFEILTWSQLGIHKKPIGLLNVCGFFDPLLSWVRHSCAEGFLRQQHVDMLHVASEVPTLLDLLLNHQEPPGVTKWSERDERRSVL